MKKNEIDQHILNGSIYRHIKNQNKIWFLICLFMSLLFALELGFLGYSVLKMKEDSHIKSLVIEKYVKEKRNKTN